MQKRCAELASRAVRTLLSLVSGDSAAAVGRLGMHAPDAMVGWAGYGDLNLGNSVRIAVNAIVTDPTTDDGAGAASGSGAAVQSPGSKSPSKVKRHKACNVTIQPYESLADVKLELCASVGADPFTAVFQFSDGTKVDSSTEGQPVHLVPNLGYTKTLILRALKAQDDPVEPRPVNTLAPALLSRWSSAHSVLLEALDAASDVKGRSPCLPLPAATIQSLWTILSRCPTEPDIEAKVRQLSATASVPPELRTFDRSLEPQNPEPSAYQMYTTADNPNIASGLTSARDDMALYLMRR